MVGSCADKELGMKKYNSEEESDGGPELGGRSCAGQSQVEEAVPHS